MFLTFLRLLLHKRHISNIRLSLWIDLSFVIPLLQISTKTVLYKQIPGGVPPPGVLMLVRIKRFEF